MAPVYNFDNLTPELRSRVEEALQNLHDNSPRFRRIFEEVGANNVNEIEFYERPPPGFVDRGSPFMSARGGGFNDVVGIVLPQDRITLTGTGPLPLDVGLGHEIAHFTPGREHGTLNVDRDLQESIVVRDENLIGMELGYAPALQGLSMSRTRNQPFNPWDRCFSAGTCINLAPHGLEPIETIVIGQSVLAFDDFGELKPARVTRLYRNVTREWLVLSNGLTVTPGHYVLNEHGAFEAIDAIVARGGKVVRADGSLEPITAERVVYSEATRHLYEEAEEVAYASDGSAALKPEVRRGWRTYNFEVEGLHTYVAGGVRVHNRSDNLDAYATLMNHDRSRDLGYRGMATEYGRNVARATAHGMDPHVALTLRERGLLGHVPTPEPTPLQRVLGLPGQGPAPKRGVPPSLLRQVLGLDPIVDHERQPDTTHGALRKVLGLDPIVGPHPERKTDVTRGALRKVLGLDPI